MRSVKRWLLRWVLLLGVVWSSLAGAQLEFTKLSLAGREVQSIKLYQAEYASQTILSEVVTIERDGYVVRVRGMGHTMLLPLDLDQQRATTDFNTVQLDTQRVKARTATLVNGNLYLPLDTLARGLGAAYQPGQFSVAMPTLQSVSSRTGKTSDRLVLDLNRDTVLKDELRGTQLRITLKNTSGQPKRYTTRGAFIPLAQVAQEGSDLVISLTMPQNSGYRVYPVVRVGGTRIVVDVGPGIPGNFPALMERIGKPLIVLDPMLLERMGRDVTLEVARRSAELLTQAGWQVKLSREQGKARPLNEKLLLARQSDVYLMLDLGRFPGADRGGITVYEGSGRSSSVLIENIRNGNVPPMGHLAVGDTGGTRRLAELLQGELKTGGISSAEEQLPRLLTLSEAPQAALLLELGWLGNAQDRANLATDTRLQALAVAIARSVATYLTARANNASQAGGAAGGKP